MKHWKVGYAVKADDGTVTEHEVIVEGTDVYEALNNGCKAMAKAQGWTLDDTDKRAVIWDVGMMGEEVF